MMPVRRSTRSRRPNSKYANQSAAILNDLLGSDQEGPDPYYLPKIREQEDDDDDDDEFDIQQPALDDDVQVARDASSANGEDVDDLSMSEADAAATSPGSEGTGIASPNNNNDDSDVDDDVMSGTDDGDTDDDHDSERRRVFFRNANEDDRRRRRKRRRRDFNRNASRPLRDDHLDTTTATTVHTRGYPSTIKRNSSKDDHWKLTFGAATADILEVIRARDRWTDVDSVTFPSKRGLRLIAGDMSKNRPDQTGGWYEREGEGVRFRKRQRVERLDLGRGRTYLPCPDPGKEDGHTVLMGPFNKQNPYHLAVGQPMDIANAWPQTPGAEPIREGWLFNVGRGARALAWAPMLPGSATQYLALCVPSSKSQKEAFFESNPQFRKQNGAKGFTPSPPTKACIQIWEFKSKKGAARPHGINSENAPLLQIGDDDVLRVMDMTEKPKLRVAICTEWGDARRLAWCPQAPSKTQSAGHQGNLIGLLSVVSEDGKVRIIEVLLNPGVDDTEYQRIVTPAFESIPPQSIFTSIHWISPTDLSLGSSHGFVAIFDIPAAMSDGRQSSQPRPYFYHQTHSSFILDLASAAPDHPHLLASTSMDGLVRLTDVRAPLCDSATGGRTRLAPIGLAYVPKLASVVFADENNQVRIQPLRRFFSGNCIGRTNSSITSIATSPVHPCLLIGAADGTALAANPVRRVVNHKSLQYQQCWFVHDFSATGRKAGNGRSVSRIHDGFTAEKSSMSRLDVDDAAAAGAGAGAGEWIYVTTWEEERHVITLAWNGNVEVGGWAAAAMGCGLIRVEDVSI